MYDPSQLELIKNLLESADLHVVTFTSAEEFYEAQVDFQLLITEVALRKQLDEYDFKDTEGVLENMDQHIELIQHYLNFAKVPRLNTD